MNDAWKSYQLSLQALELASERVRSACQGSNIETAAIEAHFGLHSVYDLHEAYFRPRRINALAEKDKILGATRGYAVGALSLARGERTHQLVTFAGRGGFGDLPYGMGPYGPGWVWKRHSWRGGKLQNRAAWYNSRVSQRFLWVPLDEALEWFNEHANDDMDRMMLFQRFDIEQPLVWP